MHTVSHMARSGLRRPSPMRVPAHVVAAGPGKAKRVTNTIPTYHTPLPLLAEDCFPAPDARWRTAARTPSAHYDPRAFKENGKSPASSQVGAH